MDASSTSTKLDKQIARFRTRGPRPHMDGHSGVRARVKSSGQAGRTRAERLARIADRDARAILADAREDLHDTAAERGTLVIRGI